MNTDLLFDSVEEKNATLKVLAAFKVKSINKNIDDLIAEILKYARDLDKLLEENGFSKRYLDRTSIIRDDELITLDEDLVDIDFRVKEVLEDLIKRINTRINLVHTFDEDLKNTLEVYNLDDIDLDKEIKTAKLTIEDFAN